MQEGKAQLKVHNEAIVSKQLEVFYNPKMQYNRDVTLAVLKAVDKKEMVIGLPLAGSGVRAVRLLLELPQEMIKALKVNDMSEQATANIVEHLALNKLENDERVSIEEKDANHFLLGHEGFDYIDIDPFGSPNPFLDAACRKLSRNALLAVTATDTATLAGRYPKTCERRYWATSLKCPLQHEIGLRILIRRVQLIASEQERYLQPILSYHQEHYYRVFFVNKRGKTKAEENYSQLNTYLYYNKDTGDYYTSEDSVGKVGYSRAGPLYAGPLHDINILNKLSKEFEEFEKMEHDIDGIGFYDTHAIASLHKSNITPIDDCLEQLQKQGFNAVRSSIQLTGIKTNAPFEIVKEVCTQSK